MSAVIAAPTAGNVYYPDAQKPGPKGIQGIELEADSSHFPEVFKRISTYRLIGYSLSSE